VLPRGLLSWASSSRWTANRPSRCLLCRVSKNQRVGLPLSRTADLLEVCHRQLEDFRRAKPASDALSCAP
jgi:hypothetical protein